MRLPASEKLEIIRLVEQSHLPARRTLEMLGIKPSTFYRWYDRFRSCGPEALEDRPSKPDRVWNRELATRFTDTTSYYVSESSVYRLLKAHDLITSPASLHRHQGRRPVQGQDNCAQPALADRLHLPQGHWLGVVLSLHHPR